MKRILLAVLTALCATLAHAGADDFVFTQRNSTDTGTNTRIPAHPTTGPGVLFYDNATITGSWATLSSRFSYSAGVLDLSFTPFSGAFSALTGKPTTLTGYGITDAYPLTGNPSGFLTSVSSAQIVAALGFTPYSAANPSSYIDQAGARTSFSLTTTGSGAATYNSGTGVLNVPTPTGAVTPTINDAPGRSLVTSTSATGYQISATRQSKGCYEGSVATTSTIGGPASATVFLETADTNSTTPGDWTVRARQTYSNTITLAVVLNQVQSNNWTLCRDIPAGKYVRLRAGAISGTASVSINSEQQEVTY